jgi:TP901 family phage tail tape measure protein
MILASQLVGIVSITGADEGAAKLFSVGAASDAAGKQIAALATGAIVLLGAVVVAKSVEMAANFQQGVNRLRTGAGDIQDSFASLSSGILQVSVATGLLTGPLTSAMYLILSSGQRGAQAFNTLTVAAKGAVIEQANVVDVANTLSGVMTNYGTKIFSATDYMNGLIFAVAHGKITLQDLATAMGPIDPIAQHLGVSFSDMAAAMTTQTNAMIPARIAATGLRFLMQGLENPTKKATDAMTAMGLNSVAVAEEMKVSLPNALEMIYNAALKAGPAGSVPFNRALADMVGGIRGTTAFMALTGPHFADFAKNAAGVATALHSGLSDVNGWAIAQSNFNVQMDKAKAAVQAVAINIGMALLPVLSTMAGWFSAAVGYVSDFKDHANVLIPILAGVGAILLAVVVPILAIGAAVAGLVAAFMHFYQTNAGFKTFIDGFVAGFKQAAGFIVANFIPAIQAVGTWLQVHVLPILQAIGSFLLATFTPVWKQLVTVWQTQIVPMLAQLWAALVPLMPVLKAIGGLILGVILVAFALFVGVLKGAVQALAGFLSGVATFIGGVVQMFTGVVQVVSGIVRFIYDLVTGNFKNLGNDLKGIWLGIENIFSGAWKAIEGIFQAAWGAISGFVSGLVSGVIGFFQHLAATLVGHSIIPDMINAIVAWFLSLPGKALNAIGSLAGNLASFFGGLARNALTWGWNIISNLAGGIINGIWSALGNAMGAIGNFISSHLPHSPAKVGPLRDLAKQGALIPDQIAQGIMSGIPKLQPSLNLMLTPRMNYTPLGFTGGGASSSSSSSGTGTPVVLQIDGYQLARILMPHVVANIRSNLAVNNL